MRITPVRNAEIADALERVADLLEAQAASVFRVRAYRNAAATVRTHPESIADVLDAVGVKGLTKLPAIGDSIAEAIREMIRTGHLGRLDRLEGEVGAEGLFQSLPGIGPDLAHRIHDALGVETLEDLETAAHDGRLERVHGFGPHRVQVVRNALSNVLTQQARHRYDRPKPREGQGERPCTALLLDVDAEYRWKAKEGKLRKIAPRRFNPDRERWLPILHTEGGGWSFTAMYSNSARAHALETTHDWVLVFYERDGVEGQATVVTETRGPRAGERVVRGV